MGVTSRARPRSSGLESGPFGLLDPMRWIESDRFLIDIVVHERLPVPVEGHTAPLPERLGAGNRPGHAGALPASLVPMPAGAFDHARGDGITGRQVLIRVQTLSVMVKSLTTWLRSLPVGGGSTDGLSLGNEPRDQGGPLPLNSPRTRNFISCSARSLPAGWNRWTASHQSPGACTSSSLSTRGVSPNPWVTASPSAGCPSMTTPQGGGCCGSRCWASATRHGKISAAAHTAVVPACRLRLARRRWYGGAGRRAGARTGTAAAGS